MSDRATDDPRMQLEFLALQEFTRTARNNHPTFTSALKVNERSAQWWTYTEEDILGATNNNGKRMERFSWNPITGEFLFVPVGQQHAMARGDAPFDNYVRGLVFPNKKLVTMRFFWPTWIQKGAYSQPDDPDAVDVSYDAQDACEYMLKRHGANGWSFRGNITNQDLEEMTGEHRW